MGTVGCKGCFKDEQDRSKKAKDHYDIVKQRTENGDNRSNIHISSTETQPSDTNPTELSDLSMDSKTIELLSNLDLIGVATIDDETAIKPECVSDFLLDLDAGTVDVANIDEQRVPDPVAYTPEDPSSIVVNPSGSKSLIEIPIDIIPESAETETTPTDIIPEASKSISEIDTNVSSHRVKQLSEILDPTEIMKTLTEQYGATDEEDVSDEEDEDEESELDEEELAEIEKRKSATLGSKKLSQPLGGPSLFRNDTDSRWDKEEIDQLRADMEQQLVSMKRESNDSLSTPHSSKPSKQYVIKVSTPDDEVAEDEKDKEDVTEDEESEDSELDISDDGEEDDVLSPLKEKGKHHPENSNLFRNQSSYKWNNLELGQMKEEMQKEMMHLLLDNTSSTGPQTN